MSLKRDLAWVFAAAALFFSIGLGAHAYMMPSEARYIEIPRQMLVTGDWVTPRINGVPFFEKPPLFYWLQAITIGLFGLGEFAGRLMTMLISAGICTITFAVARKFYGRRAGFLAAAALATSLLGYVLSRIAMLDVPVTFFITAAIASFLAAQYSTTHHQRFYLLMYVAVALATMAKGLIGIVIPGLVIGSWILLTRRWHILKEARLFTGLGILLLIVVPWHLVMAIKNPDFLNHYFMREHFARFLTAVHKRQAPWWLFTAITLVGLLPWTGILVSTFKQVSRKDPLVLFLLLWIFLPLIFFSCSHSKLMSYIFPIFPPLCILIGHTLSGMWEKKFGLEVLRWNTAFVIVIFAGVLAGYHFLPKLPGKTGRDMELLTELSPWFLVPIAAGLIGLIHILFKQRSPRTLIKGLIVFAAIVNLTGNYAWERFNIRSIKPLAEKIKPTLTDQDMVVGYNSYWHDLPVYLNRNITIVGWKGELLFGMDRYPEVLNWMIMPWQFWQACIQAPGKFYVFMDTQSLSGFSMPANCQLQTIGFYGKTVLLEKK